MADIDKYRNKNINRGYRKLEVCNEAIQLFALTKKKIKQLTNVSYKTKAQIEDSGISVPSNIAEGYSRRYLKETIQYTSIALSSLAENYTQIIALVAADDINSEWFDEYDNLHYSLENKLISYNISLLSKLKSKGEWKSDYQISELLARYNIE